MKQIKKFFSVKSSSNGYNNKKKSSFMGQCFEAKWKDEGKLVSRAIKN
jgi:hypothetical protein